MSKKRYNTSSIQNELSGASMFFQKKATPPQPDKVTSNPTRKSTRPREGSRDPSREVSRSQSPDSKNWPSRDEIQEFSFKLRDELKVKVQAEVPPAWQKEFDDLAYALDVKKPELYRFILGEFLGKVSRKQSR